VRTQSHELDKEEEEEGEEGEVSEGEETVSVVGGEVEDPWVSRQQFHLNANSSTLMDVNNCVLRSFTRGSQSLMR